MYYIVFNNMTDGYRFDPHENKNKIKHISKDKIIYIK